MLIALRSPDPMVRNHALNVIDEVAENSLEIKEAVINMVKSAGDLDRSQYDLRSARQLFSKWKLDLKRYEIVMDW